MNLPWLGCAVALALGFYGQARLWGATPLVALLATYALSSLPLFNAHVALAGNADLWMATVYGFAALSFLHWVRARDRRQGLLALGLALACSQVKVPGLVWMLTFVPALLMPQLPRAAVIALAFVASAGFAALVAGVPALDLPYLGRYRLSFEPSVGAAVAESAFALASWHLFWYVWPVLVLSRSRALRQAPAFGPMATLVVQAFLFLAGVYALSPLAAFALDFTQLNRAAMHAVPLLAFVAVAAIVGPAASSPPPIEPPART
jgi:hypothetical protein